MKNNNFKVWKKRSKSEIEEIVFSSLKKNINFDEENILGLPASYLDKEVFSYDSGLLKEAPFLTSLVYNPNHIGCHTLGKSESYFTGTHNIEKELIEICAVDFLKAEENSCDGYVASGGTEANIQAIWMYRNYYKSELKAENNEICILCSEDSHYSMNKASNLLDLSIYQFSLNENRLGEREAIEKAILKAKNEGKKHFIVVLNMMTTMFGSVDEVDAVVDCLDSKNCDYKIHIDGAYGGFYYPFTNRDNKLNLANDKISSVTLDAHKMCQAPYGTGIFIARKGLINYTATTATYVEGNDFTLIGSRSGANAIAVWMILANYGPFKWIEKTFILQKRTQWVCDSLDELNIEYYRNKYSNIITIKAKFISNEIAKKYGLVPDNHDNPNWFKIVVMDHVTIEKLDLLMDDIKNEIALKLQN